MRKTLTFILAALLLVVMVPAAVKASAGAPADCSVSPSHGIPGTVFAFSCSGFTPNTIVNVWVADPSNVGMTGNDAPGAPSNVKTNGNGDASFTWQSASHLTGNFASELGVWNWFVQELCFGKPCIVGSAIVTIDGFAEAHTGAYLTVTPDRGTVFTDSLVPGEVGTIFAFHGWGFAPREYVNLWYAQPPMCDTSDLYYSDSARSYGTVKASDAGEIDFTLARGYFDCTGTYTMTARALGSRVGAEASFVLVGHAVNLNGGEGALTVSPNPVSANLRHFEYAFTVSGSGYSAGEVVTCWTLRPDSRSGDPFDGKADASGTFSATAIGDNLDAAMPFWSAQPGSWIVTCRGNASSIAETGHFTVTAPLLDP